MRYILEIIDAERRCSNHSLLSFGVCVSNPLMRWGDTIKEAKKAFAGDLIHITEFGQDKISLKIWMDEHPEGHYLLYSQGHSLAVHDNYLVDTSLRGVGRTIVLDAYEVINNDRRIEKAFQEYMREYPDRVFKNTAPPRKRTPEKSPDDVRNKTIWDMVEYLDRLGYVGVDWEELFDISQQYKIGRYNSRKNTQMLSYNEMERLRDLWLKTPKR